MSPLMLYFDLIDALQNTSHIFHIVSTNWRDSDLCTEYIGRNFQKYFPYNQSSISSFNISHGISNGANYPRSYSPIPLPTPTFVDPSTPQSHLIISGAPLRVIPMPTNSRHQFISLEPSSAIIQKMTPPHLHGTPHTAPPSYLVLQLPNLFSLPMITPSSMPIS